jgi:hypothetical protein
MTVPAPSSKVSAAYLDALGERDPLASLAKAPRRLERLLRSAPGGKRALGTRPAPDKWSVKEILAHLVDHEFVQGTRWRFVGTMDHPTIQGYDQDAFVRGQDLAGTSAKELVQSFASARAANLALLERLGPDVWERVGLHSERGEESMKDMAWRCAGHDRIHEQQIERTLAELAARGARRKSSRSAKRSKR